MTLRCVLVLRREALPAFAKRDPKSRRWQSGLEGFLRFRRGFPAEGLTRSVVMTSDKMKSD